MPKRRFPGSGDYGVGYGRPPQTTQFKSGKSGNPKGRPKGSRTVGVMLQEILERRVSVNENGKTRRLPTLEVMLRRLANDAMRSDQRATKLLLSLIDRYAGSSENTIKLTDILAEDEEILALYLRDLKTPTLKAFCRPRKRGLMMTSRARIVAALLRTNFCAFLHKVFMTLCPGQTYVRNWHIKAIAWQLERVRRGEVRRLIINMPPRSLKSIASSVAFPAFLLGRDPSRRIICVSYSGDLAKKHSNDFRAVLESSWYQLVFPNAQIGPYKNSETEIELTERGFRLATSVGGTLTGRGGDIIIIDDPLKPDDAMSEAKRSAANNWFTNTLLSRLDDKRTGAIVIVMQRVHIDDLTGFLLEQSDEWEVLCLPAIASTDEHIPISAERTRFRRAGDVLSPEREPLQVLEAIKTLLGGNEFSAQYQQVPVPPEGNMIKRDWIVRYSALPPPFERRLTLQSWDTASKGGPDNDWSVCTTWIVSKAGFWYLADVWRGRVDYPTLKANIHRLAKQWRPQRVLVEDMGAGTSLVQELRGRVRGIIAVLPVRDKISRMAVASAMFEARQVLLPERAPWLHDLEVELFSFPGGRHDDQCDSISQALQDKKISWMTLLSDEDWQRLLQQAKMRTRYSRPVS